MAAKNWKVKMPSSFSTESREPTPITPVSLDSVKGTRRKFDLSAQCQAQVRYALEVYGDSLPNLFGENVERVSPVVTLQTDFIDIVRDKFCLDKTDASLLTKYAFQTKVSIDNSKVVKSLQDVAGEIRKITEVFGQIRACGHNKTEKFLQMVKGELTPTPNSIRRAAYECKMVFDVESLCAILCK